MNNYRVHWLDGKTEDIQGRTIAEAFVMAGYGGRAFRALDYHEKIKPERMEDVTLFDILEGVTSQISFTGRDIEEWCLRYKDNFGRHEHIAADVIYYNYFSEHNKYRPNQYVFYFVHSIPGTRCPFRLKRDLDKSPRKETPK